MSDGMMISILLLISLLIVLMTFMCIRFTLLAKIEEDYKEIGVMKAIGLQSKEIKKIYLAKYAVISVIGSLCGYLISIPLSHVLLKNIKLFMGESNNEGLSWFLAVAGVFIVMLLMIAYVYGLLNRFKRFRQLKPFVSAEPMKRLIRKRTLIFVDFPFYLLIHELGSLIS